MDKFAKVEHLEKIYSNIGNDHVDSGYWGEKVPLFKGGGEAGGFLSKFKLISI